MVLAAGGSPAGSAARHAMGQLAEVYWFPLYAYLRRQGSSASEAEDLVQGFFTRLLEKDGLTHVHPSKGKFRSFLLASLKNFLANEWDKSQAQKRGAGRSVVSLDAGEAETLYALEPVEETTPERLRSAYESHGQGHLFEVLKGSLTAGKGGESHREMSVRLGLSEGAVTVAAHRLRRRYRELLRDEIAQTVASPELIDEEIRYLLECL